MDSGGDFTRLAGDTRSGIAPDPVATWIFDRGLSAGRQGVVWSISELRFVDLPGEDADLRQVYSVANELVVRISQLK